LWQRRSSVSTWLQEDNARKGFFERHELEAVLEHLPAYWRPVMRTAYMTGWRMRSEILTREWKHGDLNAGWIRLEPGETKNRRGRMFPLTAELREILQDQREVMNAVEREAVRIIPWVFRRNGERLKDYRRAWTNAMRKARLIGRLPHDFRRTAVRNLERAGVPRSTAMAIVGHETEAICHRYAITDEPMLREGAEKLSAFHQAEARNPRKVARISSSSAQVKQDPQKAQL
jgi:integrase